MPPRSIVMECLSRTRSGSEKTEGLAGSARCVQAKSLTFMPFESVVTTVKRHGALRNCGRSERRNLNYSENMIVNAEPSATINRENATGLTPNTGAGLSSTSSLEDDRHENHTRFQRYLFETG